MSYTPQQCKDIKRTWNPVKANYEKHSAKFLHNFFIQHQGYLKLFTYFNDGPIEDLGTDERFITYAVKIFMNIGEFVDCIDDSRKLAAQLDYLGTSHRPRGATPSHFQSFTPMLLEYLRDVNTGASWNRSAEQAWTKLFDQLNGVVSTKLA